MSPRKASFAPEVEHDARILVLGSLPGERSLAEARYYAHPRNRFWHLVGKVIRQDLMACDYPDRLATLKRHQIGLWDVVASAQRQGSLDGAIRDAVPNPLAELVGSLPQLRAVAFNGRASEKIGRPQLAGTRLALIALPSSSPANATMSLSDKENCWLVLRDFLETPDARAH